MAYWANWFAPILAQFIRTSKGSLGRSESNEYSGRVERGQALARAFK